MQWTKIVTKLLYLKSDGIGLLPEAETFARKKVLLKLSSVRPFLLDFTSKPLAIPKQIGLAKRYQFVIRPFHKISQSRINTGFLATILTRQVVALS